MDKKLFEYFLNDRFATGNGIELVKMDVGYSLAKMEVKESHLNAAGTVQGGALFTLADFAFGAASNAYGHVALSISSSITFFKKSKVGDILYAKANEISKSRRLAHHDVLIYNQDEEPVAKFSGTLYITLKPII
ncbi:MAG: PaaI family thioesterase [Bacteroidota bacterium]